MSKQKQKEEQQRQEQQKKKEEKLIRMVQILRFAGINLQPQMVAMIMDKHLRSVVDKVSKALDKSGDNLSVSDIDKIIKEVDAEVEKSEKKVELETV